MVVTKVHKDIKPILMNPTKKGVKYPYYQILEESQTVLVVSPGLNGLEFNKTNIFFNNLPGVVIYHALYGAGIAIIQRIDGTGEAKEFKVVSLTAGTLVNVPAGWAACLVNVGKGFLVAITNMKIESTGSELDEITKRRGLAYYVIEKKGEISFEQNPNYKVYPQISTE